jgi:uncharacterized protein YukE
LPALTELLPTVPDGDPAELRDVARFLRAAAEALTQVASNVWAARSMVGSCWRGPASLFFDMRVKETIAAIETAPTACHGAADALARLADDIEGARRRAIAALADAESAQNHVNAASLEMVASGATAVLDPAAQLALQRRLDAAREDLAGARARAARASQDAVEAGHRAAAVLHAAADAVKAPPPPAGSDVVPFETTRQWFHRQLGDILIDPVTFWAKDKTPYQQRQVAFDLYTGAIAGAIDGADRSAPTLFKGIVGTRTLGGLSVMQRQWITRPGAIPIADWVETRTPIVREYKLGPDAVAAKEIGKVGKVAKYGGWVLAGGTAALDQWVQDRARDDLSGGQKVGRIAASIFFTGGSSVVGGMVGFNTGLMVGGLSGSVAGAVAGGIAGTMWFGGIGQAAGEKVKETFFNKFGMN